MTAARLIQVPYYLGREHAGLSRGPSKLAAAIGGETVVVDPPRPDVLPNEIAESFEVIRAVAAVVRETVEEGRFPLVLAVNCFTSLGTVSGLGRDVGVIWFDAHGDFHTPDTTTSGFFDGMGLAMLLGDGWSELRRSVAGLRPIPAEHALLAGARDIDPTEQDRFAESPLRRADMQTLDKALEELSREVDTVYVHLDLDVVDASVARANALSVEGGFDVAGLERALAAISSRFEIAAAAMTAYDPSVDPEGRIPPIAAALAPHLVPERVGR